MVVTYANRLSYIDLINFLKKELSKKYDKTVIVFPNSVRDFACYRQFKFEIKIGDNDTKIPCEAKFKDFECVISIEGDTDGHELTIYKPWAKYVYNILKLKETLGAYMTIFSDRYKRDYNAYMEDLKDEKVKIAKQEYDGNILR